MVDTTPAHAARVLSKLTGVRATSDGWDALCPVPGHNRDGDQSPSLRVTIGDDGRVLVVCRVGCHTADVLDAAGLDWSDLFADGGGSSPDDPDAAVEAVTPCLVTAVRPVTADAVLLDRAYSLMLAALPLSDDHRADLRRRGLVDVEIDNRGYKSLRGVDRGAAAKAAHGEVGDPIFHVPGFVRGEYGVTLHGTATGLLVPVRDLDGRVVALKVRRAGEPKYVYVTGDDVSPGSPVHVPLGVKAPVEVVRITEGELKADVAFCLDGTATVGVPGVTQWLKVLPVLKALAARTVVIAYDAGDVRSKPPVFEQAEELYHALVGEGYMVEVEVWE